MEIIIDTNFILTCVKQRIDLFSQLEELFPFCAIIIPVRVIEELQGLKAGRGLKVKERESANLALQILNINKNKIKFVKLERNVDESIINYALKHENVVIASLDKAIRNRVKGKAKLLTIRGRNRIWAG